MDAQSDLTASVGPEVVPAEDQGQVETPAAEAPETPVAEEQKQSETQSRRERDKAYRERLRKDAEEARARAAELEARHKRIADAAKSVDEPSEADFPDPIERASAVAVWKMQKREKAREAQDFQQEVAAAQTRAQEAEKAEQAALAQQWSEQVREARARYADFDQVALRQDVEISAPLATMLVGTENGTDILYHLAQDPAKAAHLSRLSLTNPMAAGVEIGRIAASVSLPKPRTATAAPSPINPVKGTAGTVNPDSMSPAEFAEWRAKGGTFTL